MKLLGSEPEALVHAFWGDHDLGYLDLLARRKGHPLCATFHNCDDTLAENIRFPSRVRSLSGVILMSETQRPFFEKCGVPADRINVILHGVDTSYFRPLPPRENSKFTILTVGSYRRNFALVRQICLALANRSDIGFRVVAGSHAKHFFDGLANVAFLSGISDEQLLREYQNASCFLMTAGNATANNALLEAMSCGLPIVAERVGGIPEYAPESAGLFVKPGNHLELAAALGDLARDPARCNSMGIAARNQAERLDWKAVASRTAAVYERIL